MRVKETRIQEISLDSNDIKEAIVFYLKERGYREIAVSDVNLSPDKDITAKIKITEILNPEDKNVSA